MKSTASAIPTAYSRTTDLVALAKPRLNLLVVVSAVAGYVMASGDTRDVWRLLCMIAGTGLVAGGASAFNQIIEREPDGLMQRTRLRPMPDGRLPTRDAWFFGAALTTAGLGILALGANLLSAIVAFATLASYVVVYTPLKRRSTFSTVIGAIPGALPPVIGWAAALDELSQGAWVLFGIVFLWQLPHFLAIAWIYREDYARAGFPMLPVVEPDGHSTRARPSSTRWRSSRSASPRRSSAWPVRSTSRARSCSPCSSSAWRSSSRRLAASPMPGGSSSVRSPTCRSSGC